MIESFDPQSAAMIAWAFAEKGVMVESFFLRLAWKVETTTLEYSTPHSISNLAWAFATLQIRVDPLFAAMAEETQLRVNEFGPQELVQTVWSFAQVLKADYGFEAFFRGIAAEVERSLTHNSDQFTTANLADLAWAYAMVGLPKAQHSLFLCIAQVSQRRLDEFKPGELASLNWAFAKLEEDKENEVSESELIHDES